MIRILQNRFGEVLKMSYDHQCLGWHKLHGSQTNSGPGLQSQSCIPASDTASMSTLIVEEKNIVTVYKH